MMTEAKNKVALVTGASSGIGKATAARLIRAGYRVFGTSRKAASGEIVNDVRMVRCDVTLDASVAQAVGEVVEQSARIDVLVNNAGIGMVGAAEESSIAQVQSLFDTNLYGIIRMTNAVLPIMRRQHGGRIINLSSLLGMIPAPFSAYYAGSKYAIEGYSESLDHEVRTFGVRVVLIEPGLTRSTFEQSSTPVDQPLDAYAEARTNAIQWMADGMKVADTSETVAETILQAVKAAKPRLRYTSGRGVRRTALLRRFVPAPAFDKSLRKVMRLP